MPVQTTYNRLISPALPGLLVDVGPNYKKSFINANGTPLDFGLGVVQGATDREAKLPSAAGQKFLGVTIREGFREITAVGGAVTSYAAGEMMNVLVKLGTIWVYVDSDVAIHDPVYCRFAAQGSYTTIGIFRNSADTVDGVPHADLVPNAEFYTSASAGGLAQIIFPK